MDLEVDPKHAKIFALAAVTHDPAFADFTAKPDFNAGLDKPGKYCRAGAVI